MMNRRSFRRIAASSNNNHWIVIPRPNKTAKVRLFCFPYAGGSASIFRRWPEFLPDDIELLALQPPGREERFSEPLIDRLYDMVNAYVTAMSAFLDRRFFLFGHSIGARIAYEVAKNLGHARRRPLGLIVSAARAPHLPKDNPVYHLPDALLIQKIREMKGTPEEILCNNELMQLLLPKLRADYTMADTAPLETGNVRLPCPLIALGGLHDTSVSIDQLAQWKKYTTGKFAMRLFDGDHFYIHSSGKSLSQVVSFIISSIFADTYGDNLGIPDQKALRRRGPNA